MRFADIVDGRRARRRRPADGERRLRDSMVVVACRTCSTPTYSFDSFDARAGSNSNLNFSRTNERTLVGGASSNATIIEE